MRILMLLGRLSDLRIMLVYLVLVPMIFAAAWQYWLSFSSVLVMVIVRVQEFL